MRVKQHNPLCRHSTKAANGFSLVELLVALVVLSIGFVGYAALQIIGVRSVEDSYQRTQMTMYVEELAERMRTNRAAFAPLPGSGMSAYHGLNYAQDEDPKCDGSGSIRTDVLEVLTCEDDGDDAFNCDSTEMAQYDVARVFCGYRDPDSGKWSGGITSVSEGASISVTCNTVPDPLGGPDTCPAGTPHTITATWKVAETDRNDEVSMDGDDGDPMMMTQRVNVMIRP